MITWLVLRAAGIGAYLMLFGSVAWGLIATSAPFGKKVSKATAISVHQFISTVALLLLGAHLGGLLLDKYVKFRPLDLLVPMHSAFKPVAVAFGVLALYATVIVLASSWARKQVGPKMWRALHMLTVPMFIMAMIHGIFAGTDTVRPWMWWTYVATGGIVLFLVILRGLTADLKPERHARPAHATRAPRPGAAPAAQPQAATPAQPKPAAPAPRPAPSTQPRPAAAPQAPPEVPPVGVPATPPAAEPEPAPQIAASAPATTTVAVPVPSGTPGTKQPTVILKVEVSFVPGEQPTARIVGAEPAEAAEAEAKRPEDVSAGHDAEVLPFVRHPRPPRVPDARIPSEEEADGTNDDRL